MGIFSALGGAVGTFFGGPVGTAIGTAVGGMIDQDSATSQANSAQTSTNQFNATQAQLARDFNAQQAATARQWAEQQRATAYQATTADMKAAGLNPMLAYSQGATSTPGAASASGPAATSVNVHPQEVSAEAAQTQAANMSNVSAQQVQNLSADTQVKDAQAGLIHQQTLNSAADTALKGKQAEVAAKTVDLVSQQVQTSYQDQFTKLSQENLNSALTDLNKVIEQKVTYELRNLNLTAAQIQAVTEQTQAKTQLLMLEVPQAKNEAAAQSSYFKKNVSPYVGDVGKVINSAGSLLKFTSPY